METGRRIGSPRFNEELDEALRAPSLRLISIATGSLFNLGEMYKSTDQFRFQSQLEISEALIFGDAFGISSISCCKST